MKPKILIIEDELDLVKGLKLNLAGEGYDVDWVPNGAMGIDKVLRETPDLIILDLMLPEVDGLEVCRRLRQNKIGVPIIMLTAKGEEVDKVLGLEMGADDYITKPFSIRELLARIRAHLRREERKTETLSGSYRFGEVEIDFDRFKVRQGREELDITSLEMKILKYFIANRLKVVTRDELLDKVWGYKSYPTTRTIDNHIMKLRKKIEKNPSRPEFLLSVYGEGYRFTG